MSVPTTVSSLLPTVPNVADAKAAVPKTQAQIETLAQEFDSLMLVQVMRQLRQSLASFGDDEGDKVGGDLSAMTEAIDTELSRYLSKSGGLGLGGFLAKAIGRQQGSLPMPTPAPGAPAGASPSAGGSIRPAAVTGVSAAANEPTRSTSPTRSTGDEAASDVSLASAESVSATSAASPAPNGALDYVGSVTSRFGWRSDPFVHTAKFHGGVDIRAAYGQQVPVAGDGQVVFSGEQSGYGMTVMVQHPGGFQTRYAHLSAIDVQNGEQVVSGQPIGRAGQSGRATGPHLHFELTRDGQKLDPTSVVRSAAGFKQNQVAADYTSGKPSGRNTVLVGSTGANDDAVGSTQ